MKNQEEIIAYKRDGRMLYFVHKGDNSVHFVPTVNWFEYLALRLNIPKLCKIADTIVEALDKAEDDYIN